MFGHHKARRQEKKANQQKQNFEKEKTEWDKNSPQRLKEAEEGKKTAAADKAQQNKLDRANARAEGKTYAEEVLGRDVEGLSPKEKQAMQYEANKGIQRSQQQANRKLLGDQASHGVAAKSGVGYAQQKDLQKIGMEAKGAAERDLTKADQELKRKKLAAMFAIEQGEASQAQMDKQLAQDELNYEEEKRKNKQYEDDMRNYWANQRV